MRFGVGFFFVDVVRFAVAFAAGFLVTAAFALAFLADTFTVVAPRTSLIALVCS